MEQWVNAAKTGDQHAWNMLYQKHYPALLARALSLCRKTDEAKDAVQETFVIAFLRLDQLKDFKAFPGWIRQILVHICYRTLHARQYGSSGLQVNDDTVWEDEVNKKLEQIAADNRLHATMANIPEALRSTVLLRYFSGFGSYEQIARILAIPVGTVRSRLNQAKLKFIQNWQEREDANDRIFAEGRMWNQFYEATFGTAHADDHAKDKLLSHLRKDIEVVYTSGKKASGRVLIENEVHADREHGSWMEPTNVVSSGSISIIEAKNYNSAEYPDRCPPNSVFVLFRDNKTAKRIHFHHL